MSEPSEVTFASAVYLRARAIWRGQRPRALCVRGGAGQSEQSVPFGKGREPRLLGEVFEVSVRELGWSAEIAQVKLITDWPRFVGEQIAEHTTIVGLDGDVLTVQCDSTAWATELRRLRGEILTRILTEYPDAEIAELKFLAPGAPSWKHGTRTVRGGRGPRDTYG